MIRILPLICEQRSKLGDCGLYKFLRDHSVDPDQKMRFAPYVAYFSMSFGDLMSTVMKRPQPKTELDRLVNAHCSEDDFHWRWYLQDIQSLGYNRTTFTESCELLWSIESAPVRHLIYSVLGYGLRCTDPLFHLILIEILEAGLSGFFEYCYKDVARGGLGFLKYFGETHYMAEYKHSVTTWFQVVDGSIADTEHPLAKFEVSPEVRSLALEAIDVIFARFHDMYAFWLKAAAAPDKLTHRMPSGEASNTLL